MGEEESLKLVMDDLKDAPPTQKGNILNQKHHLETVTVLQSTHPD